MQESAAIQAERKRLADEWDRGLLEGYEQSPNVIPGFMLVYLSLTPRQRAYIMGREIRLMEMAGGK